MADLTTLALVRSELNIEASFTDDDAFINELIDGVSAQIIRHCGRAFINATYTERYDGIGGPTLMPRNLPIVSVSSLTVDGTVIAAAADSEHAGYMVARNRVIIVGGGMFTRGLQNVAITYVAGYGSTVPDDVRRAATIQAAHEYRQRDRLGQTSVSVGQSTTGYTQSELLPEVQAKLKLYVRVSFGGASA